MTEPIYIDMSNPEQRAKFDAAMPYNRFYEEETKRYGYYEATPERSAEIREWANSQTRRAENKAKAEARRVSQ
jgi:hypothetical protein